MKRLLILPFLLWATTAYCNPSNSLSLTNVVSGTVIASTVQNNNNNTTVSTYNSHTHTDIAQLATVTVGVWNATPVQIQFGGTGQTTANQAFKALSPMATAGDMEYLAGTTPTALGIGANATFLGSDGTTPTWTGINLSHAVGAGTAATLGCVTGILPISNGGTGTSTGALPVSGSYSGNGGNGYAVAHNLGRTPKFIIFYNLTGGSGAPLQGEWITGSGVIMGNNNAAWNSISVDSTNFTLNNDSHMNANGATYFFVAL
jgi:hypothetical protein